MSEELLINVTPSETRVAVVENGMLQEVFIERARSRGLVSNIYKGKVKRVLPGMQAAFIDIGLERTAFLHVADMLGHQPEGKQESINHLLHDGDHVLVQVIKDPMGTKGARLTTNITIPSRYLVFMPGGKSVGISLRIDDEDERKRLKDCVSAINTSIAEDGGYIIRTVAEGACEEALRADMRFLRKQWESMQTKTTDAPAGACVHEDLPLMLKVLRDRFTSDIEKIRIDSRETFHKVKDFMDEFIPELSTLLEYYPGERPIFDLYGVEDEIQKALNQKVQLKSGGYLIIDQTEAMTTIDVNTGAYVGHRNLEETIFKTNLEAAQALVRQLRLRNLGGIIIIDFIDMSQEEHKRQVLRALEKTLEKDNAKSKISEVSSLGLVQMTRKRTRESHGHILC